MEYSKTDRASFPGKFIFAQIWAKSLIWPHGPKIGFLDFWKNFVIRFLLLLVFQHQFHIWPNSESPVMDTNAVSQENCKFLENVISQRRSEL